MLGEATQILDLFLDNIIENFDHIKNNEDALYRLAVALELSGVGEVGELYNRFEEVILENFNKRKSFLTVELIRIMSRISSGRNGGTRDFWVKVGSKIDKNFLQGIEPYHAIELLQVFSALNMIDALKDKQEIISQTKTFLKTWNASYKDLKKVCQAITYGNIEDAELLELLVKKISKMQFYIPSKHYASFKHLMIHAEHRHPEWNYSYLENRLYHASSDYQALRSISVQKEKQLTEIYSLLNQKAATVDGSEADSSKSQQLDLRITRDWQNIFVVDLALVTHRVGVVIDYDTNENLSDFDCPRFRLKKRLLSENGWRLAEVNYNKFLTNPKAEAERLSQELHKHFKKAVEEEGSEDDIIREANRQKLKERIEYVIPEEVKSYLINQIQANAEAS